MTLYELALHPGAYAARRIDDFTNDTLWWGNYTNSTAEQFGLLNLETWKDGTHIDSPSVDENVFRMYLLMVHWMTEGEANDE